MKIINYIDRVIHKITVWLLVISVTGMTCLTFTGIVARQFSVTFLWLDPLVRHLVFASAFLGGILATGAKGHIAIDVVSKYLEMAKLNRVQAWITRLINLVSASACIWLAYWGLELTIIEKEVLSDAFLGFHSYQMVAIIPIGLSIIALRFFLNFILSFERDIPQRAEAP